MPSRSRKRDGISDGTVLDSTSQTVDRVWLVLFLFLNLCSLAANYSWEGQWTGPLDLVCPFQEPLAC
jgi:hypothetical protein